MAKININVERLKKEVLDIDVEIKDGETVSSVVEQFKKDYENGKYHNQFDDYGSQNCDVCFQNLSVYDEDFNNIYLENLDPLPDRENSKKRKP